MTDHPIPRHFPTDAAIRDVGGRFLACTLPKAEWTHEAHLATCLWLIVERPDIDVDAAIGGLIRTYNASVGGVNDDTQCYHDTITRAYVLGIRIALAGEAGQTLAEKVNALLDSPIGRRDWPLNFWSRDLLFSIEARRGWVSPDLSPLPAATKSV